MFQKKLVTAFAYKPQGKSPTSMASSSPQASSAPAPLDTSLSPGGGARSSTPSASMSASSSSEMIHSEVTCRKKTLLEGRDQYRNQHRKRRTTIPR